VGSLAGIAEAAADADAVAAIGQKRTFRFDLGSDLDSDSAKRLLGGLALLVGTVIDVKTKGFLV